MLTAGDLIDNTLGVKFGLATLTAAACGQVVSDVCGVCFGGTVEAFATKLGLKPPDLSLHQRGLKISRLVATSGAAVGVVVGCLLGMLTLLCMDTTSADREKKQVCVFIGICRRFCASVLVLVCIRGVSSTRLKNHRNAAVQSARR